MTPFLPVLLDASIRITAVAMMVWFTLAAAKIRPGSVRHAAWLAVLFAMPLMPVLSSVVPSVNIPVTTQTVNTELIPIETGPLATGPSQAFTTPIANAPEPRTVPAPQPMTSWISGWRAMLVFIYAAVLLVLLSRCLAGWLNMHRILRSSRHFFVGNTPVYESAMISAPVTVGLLKQKILLPAEWSEWPENKLRAVLAHESAHVKRRDTMTGLLAHLNRCLFWFHPLAWWLERQLALTAEQACDDAGVMAMGENRKYAQVLLEMAEAVRRRGRLLSFAGAGVTGEGLLGHRIERLLKETPFSKHSGSRKIIVALSCTAAIFLAAACRQKGVYTGELRPDPAYAQQQESSDRVRTAYNMNAPQAEALDAYLKQNPEDQLKRCQLMTFYQANGRRLLGDKITTERFWANKLWFIEHQPENQCASMANPLWDRAAYEKGKKLWLSLLERPDASLVHSLALLSNASAYFEKDDPQLAEKLLLRAQKIARDRDRSAPRPVDSWSFRLGRLYASVITQPGSHGSYAQEVRKKLETSRDPALLSAVGERLPLQYPGGGEFSDLSKSYLQRALQIDPNYGAAKNALMLVQEQERRREEVPEILRSIPSEAQYGTVSALPESERFRYLGKLAQGAYIQSNILEYNNQPGMKKQWELARKYAEDALRLAPKYTTDPNYGNTIYVANMVLGMLAMRQDGDIKSATKYLLAASRTPGTNIDITVSYLTTRLPTLLLKYGGPDERKAVIEYLERCGQTTIEKNFDLLHSAQQLRAGYMPRWYQSEVAGLK